jgi:alkanesulfonate monooxygenase SsuD/methylene tetrahydromethanopterin reductase-like flavin-dependent oxidoreductase (luciferase family)
MDFGAHLPIMDFGGNPYTLEHLVAYTLTGARLGFSALATNDHMVFSVPWLDGLTALAAVIGRSGTMTLATTVSLPVIRGPVPLAKTLAAIDRLSQGRLVVAVGPGSSQGDFGSVGVDFAERWARLDESIGALRALWRAGLTQPPDPGSARRTRPCGGGNGCRRAGERFRSFRRSRTVPSLRASATCHGSSFCVRPRTQACRRKRIFHSPQRVTPPGGA